MRDYFTAAIVLRGSTYFLQSANQALLKTVQPYSRGGTLELVPSDSKVPASSLFVTFTDSVQEEPVYALEMKAANAREASGLVASVKDYLFRKKVPVIEEYDFLNENRWASDSTCENLVISLNEVGIVCKSTLNPYTAFRRLKHETINDGAHTAYFGTRRYLSLQ